MPGTKRILGQSVILSNFIGEKESVPKYQKTLLCRINIQETDTRSLDTQTDSAYVNLYFFDKYSKAYALYGEEEYEAGFFASSKSDAADAGERTYMKPHDFKNLPAEERSLYFTFDPNGRDTIGGKIIRSVKRCQNGSARMYHFKAVCI